MNYLAHAYFSFLHEEVMVGNLISDFVKGKRKYEYSPGIQNGIAIHRAIDAFTDHHAATREAKTCFRSAVGSYAGAFIDIVYDHFLATSEEHWRQLSLEAFAPMVYQTLEANYQLLPVGLQQMLPYMKNQNWLLNYQFSWGIERSFAGLARRAVYLNDSSAAFNAFLEHYDVLAQLSQAFIPDVKKFASEQFDQLIKS